jgi:hypothetical protein
MSLGVLMWQIFDCRCTAWSRDGFLVLVDTADLEGAMKEKEAANILDNALNDRLQLVHGAERVGAVGRQVRSGN